MAVDSLAFLGNLFAELLPSEGSAWLGSKRRIELLMSGTAPHELHGLRSCTAS